MTLIKKDVDAIIYVVTTEKIPANTKIITLKGEILESPNKYSYQIGKNRHLDRVYGIQDELRHSCDPNCYVDIEKLELVALKDIGANEELTINYCCTEENMAEPFICNCNSINCYKNIKGFIHLDNISKQNIKSFLSKYLYEKYF
jgi:hypothetical protein